MLTTDGRVSFATFLYENVQSLVNLIEIQYGYVVGFNAGDRTRFTNVDRSSLRSVEIYRIDGEQFFS